MTFNATGLIPRMLIIMEKTHACSQRSISIKSLMLKRGSIGRGRKISDMNMDSRTPRRCTKEQRSAFVTIWWSGKKDEEIRCGWQHWSSVVLWALREDESETFDTFSTSRITCITKYPHKRLYCSALYYNVCRKASHIIRCIMLGWSYMMLSTIEMHLLFTSFCCKSPFLLHCCGKQHRRGPISAMFKWQTKGKWMLCYELSRLIQAYVGCDFEKPILLFLVLIISTSQQVSSTVNVKRDTKRDGCKEWVRKKFMTKLMVWILVCGKHNEEHY